MITFVEKARTTGMVELNDRISSSKDRLAYLIDVFLFPPEDISLNCEVLTWPKNINPVFERNEEVHSLGSLHNSAIIYVFLQLQQNFMCPPSHYSSLQGGLTKG